MIQGEWYTPAELEDLPELNSGQADSQVGATQNDQAVPGTQRVWYSRVNRGEISVETMTPAYNWDITYEGYPTRVRINYADTVEVEE